MKFFITSIMIICIVMGIIVGYCTKVEKVNPTQPITYQLSDTNYVMLTLAEYKKMDSVVAIVLNK